MVEPFAALVGQLRKCRGPVFELHARQKRLTAFFSECSRGAHRVFAFNRVARMHQTVGKITAVGKKQQPLGIKVQTPHRNPAAVADLGKVVKHRGTSLGIVHTDNLTGGLMVDKHSRHALAAACAFGLFHNTAVHAHDVGGKHTLSEMGGFAVHRNPALKN